MAGWRGGAHKVASYTRGLLLVAIFHLATMGLSSSWVTPSQAQDPAMDMFLLAVSACPPYRHDVAPEVCTNAVNSVTDELAKALDIPDQNIIGLTEEKASGPKVLDAIRRLAEKSGPEDYLIFFLSGHGGTYSEWGRFSAVPERIGRITENADSPDDYVLVFWSEEEPSIPALSLKEQIYIPVSLLLDTLDEFPGKYAVILDSCSSNLAFEQFVGAHKKRDKLDFLLTAAGPNQISSINFAGTAPLMTENLIKALSAPSVVFFGEAVDQARAMTTLAASGICSSLTVPVDEYHLVFPGHPDIRPMYDRQEVGLPFWFCTQVPSVADSSGFLSGIRLKQQSE